MASPSSTGPASALASSAAAPLRALCAAHPLALGLLHARGLSATRAEETLDAACHERGQDPLQLLAELEAAERALDEAWQGRPLPELIDHVLRAFHQPFLPELDRAAALLEVAEPGTDAAALGELRALLAELRADMQLHLAKEEQVLFPWLRAHVPAAAVRAIRAMLLEHADVQALLHALHAAAARAFSGGGGASALAALAALERALCEHMHLEDHQLFPRALTSP